MKGESSHAIEPQFLSFFMIFGTQTCARLCVCFVCVSTFFFFLFFFLISRP